MHILHVALDQREDLRVELAKLSEKIGSNPLKHAIILDFNPYWLAAFRATELGLSEYAFGSAWPLLPSDFQLAASLNGPIAISDLQRKFKLAESQTAQAFGRSYSGFEPFVARVYIKPDHELRVSGKYYPAILSIARESALPVLVETHAQARLLASSGKRFSASGRTGTLGGFLRDWLTGQVYGVTCGHVVSSGVASDSSGVIGRCVHALLPVPHPNGQNCSSSCLTVTRADVALLEVQSFTSKGIGVTPAQTIANGDLVEMELESGPVHYVVGGAVVEHAIGGSCWTRLFQIHAPIPAGILPAAAYVATTPLPKDGDSGAWLFRGESEWAGMVVAADRLHGYALAPTTVVTEADKAFGTQLVTA
jgi:hypothetical protein